MSTAHLLEVFGVTRRRFDQDGIGRLIALLVRQRLLFTALDLLQRVPMIEPVSAQKQSRTHSAKFHLDRDGGT